MLLRHISYILHVIILLCSITHTYLYPQVNKGQPRTLALVLIWDWNVCFPGERWKGMMPPATSTQGGKGCSSTMASFHLQDPAKWVQLSCKIETLRHSSVQSLATLYPLQEHPAHLASRALLLTESPGRWISAPFCHLPGRGGRE